MSSRFLKPSRSLNNPAFSLLIDFFFLFSWLHTVKLMEWGVMKPWGKCSLDFRGMAGGPNTWASPGYLNPCLGNKPIRITTALPQSCMPHRSSIYPVCLHATNIHKEKAKNKNNWKLGTYLIGRQVLDWETWPVQHASSPRFKLQHPKGLNTTFSALLLLQASQKNRT